MPHSIDHEISPTRHAVRHKATTLLNGQYARCTIALNDVLNALRDCGPEQVLSLPKIVVVGNQSAGKSSLIEAKSVCPDPAEHAHAARPKWSFDVGILDHC